MSGGTDRPDLRVAMLTHVARPSGAELAMLRTMLAFEAVQPVLFCAEDGPLVERLLEAGIESHVIPLDAAIRGTSRNDVSLSRQLSRSKDVGAHAFRLAGALRDARIDIVHTNSNKSHVYGSLAARLARRHHVMHVRDRLTSEFMHPAGVALMRAVALTATAVVANSESTLATVPRLPRSGQPRLVSHSPIDVPDRLRHADHPGPYAVAHVGRLTPWKGQDLFLRAFARAHGGSDVTARIAGAAMFPGDEHYADGLHDLAAALGIEAQVEFLGHVDDVYRMLGAVDVLVHSSTIPEPFGQVVAQGLAMGLPVVASAEGGPTELIKDGSNGLLFEPRSVEGLAAALRRLHGDAGLRRSLSERAPDVTEKLAPRTIAAQLEALYASLPTRSHSAVSP